MAKEIEMQVINIISSYQFDNGWRFNEVWLRAGKSWKYDLLRAGIAIIDERCNKSVMYFEVEI